ncbi:MAG: type IV secretory system conjugative DNA transfer family protein [Acidimicrobiales bacterium]
MHGLSALVAAGVLGGIWMMAERRGDRFGARSRGHGDSARWATRRDLRTLVVRGAHSGRLVLGTHGRNLVAADARHSVLVVGPTQSHKTSGLAIPALLEWDGPVLAASVKSDLVARTIAWRRHVGTAWVYDPSRATSLGGAWWSPVDAVGDWASARRMARRLTDASRPAGGLPDAEFWYQLATKLLAPLLLAAARSGYEMDVVARWIDEQEQPELEQILGAHDELEALRALRATWWRDERQRSAVYSTAETIVDVFADLHASDHAPRIDPDALVAGTNTLYLCAPAHEQRRLQPLFSALASEAVDRAVARAERQGAPLDPPLLVVIDEAANVAPLAELDELASTAAGHGIQLVTVWQDMAQITARYGERAGTVVNNHRAKLFLSGIADPVTLDNASALIGEEEHPQQSTTTDGRARSVTTSPVTRRLAPPDRVRRVPPGHGVLVCGHLPAVRLKLRPWWKVPLLRRRALSPEAQAAQKGAPGATSGHGRARSASHARSRSSSSL